METGKIKIKTYLDGTIRIIKLLQNGGKIDVGLRGYGRMILYDPDMSLVHDTDWLKNSFTNTGKTFCAKFIGNVESLPPMNWLAVGTSNTAENDTDYELGAEVTDSGLIRAQDPVTSVYTTTTTDDTLKVDHTWVISGAKALWEIGLFNAATNGDMIGRTVSPTVVNAEVGYALNGLYIVRFA